MKPASRAVHSGREIKARTPLAPAITPAAVHVYEDLDDYEAVASGERPGYFYGRNSNENRSMLEAAIAELEGAEAAVSSASGMAALHMAILALAPRPTTIVATRELYGGTMSLLRQDLEPSGYEPVFVDVLDLDAVSAALNGAGLVLLETITNPLCRVPDVEAIVGMAKERGVPVLVDNTFATPILCRPIELGADVVMHSATSTSAGTRTCSRGSWPAMRRRSRPRERARCAWAARSARSTHGWPCVACARSRCGYAGIARTPSRSRKR
ncbi:MAG: aminotransferase class I/II-fold pyridoxal phosphate-dependent enzyme [Chloroflexi bacterium]|nr:MAG: aminotransferase class I/II-fold pyridoxal phosphate-dependent enzyme [Chloroflexota bacterium]